MSNAATGAFLEGVRVQIDGSERLALTDREGRFQFAGLPAGDYVLRVSYTGLDPAAVSAAVSQGEVTRKQIELTSEVYRLSPFTVAGEREGSALAVTLQRQADNVKEVLSSDAFGSLSNQNMGNLLQRLSGVSTDWVEGEPKTISIRGLAPNLNNVTIDGVDMPTGTVKSAQNRGVEIDTVPADFISMIEVTKAPTPDMPAHAIGGSVNLVSKSPFEARSGLRYTAGFSYDLTNGGKAGPYSTVQYNRIFGANDRIGLLLTSSYSEFAAQTSVVELAHLSTGVTPAWARLTRFREDRSEKGRFSVGSRLSYRFSGNTWVTGSFLYSKYDDVYRAFANQFSGGAVVAGFTDRAAEFANSTFTSAVTQRISAVNNYKFGLTGRHTTAAGRFDVDLAYMPSDGTEKRFNHSRTKSGVRTLTDRTRSLHYPEFRQTGGPDITDLNGSALTVARQDNKAFDDIVSARADYRHDIALAVPLWFQGGARFLSREKSQNFGIDNYNYVGTAPLAPFLDSSRRVLIDGSFPYIPFADNRAIESDFYTNPARYAHVLASSTSASALNDYVIREDVTGAYVMGGVKLGRLSALGGLRTEWTHLEGRGIAERTSFAAPLERYGSVRTGEANYRNVFPGIHFKYETARNFVARASYNLSIARPNFRNIIPRISINETSFLLTANNPNLKPQFSDNFDVTFEYYFEPIGLFSAGAFLKEINNFQFTTDTLVPTGQDNGFEGQFAGYTLRTQHNGGTARVRGLEFNYRQQLTFLPGWWKGFGLYANFTYLETEGTYDSGVAQLAGFVPKTANVGISYSAFGLTARIQGNYRSTYLAGFAANALNREINSARKMLDLNIEYMFSKRLGVTVSFNNLTDAPEARYAGRPDRSHRYLEDGRKMTFGLSGRF